MARTWRSWARAPARPCRRWPPERTSLCSRATRRCRRSGRRGRERLLSGPPRGRLCGCPMGAHAAASLLQRPQARWMLCLSLLGMLAARMVGIRLPARCQPAWALVRHARLSLQASLADRRPARQASMLHVRGPRVDRRRVASALQLLQARAHVNSCRASGPCTSLQCICTSAADPPPLCNMQPFQSGAPRRRRQARATC